MDESFDWDSLTFSLTPTETMYLTTTTANDPWMPGELRPYGDIPMSVSYTHLTLPTTPYV